MGLLRVRELTLRSNLYEVNIEGRHFEGLARIERGTATHDMGVTLDKFLA